MEAFTEFVKGALHGLGEHVSRVRLLWKGQVFLQTHKLLSSCACICDQAVSLDTEHIQSGRVAVICRVDARKQHNTDTSRCLDCHYNVACA